MFKIADAFLLCLLAQILCYAAAHYNREPIIIPLPVTEAIENQPATCATDSAVAAFQLCRDFREMRDLIPANTLAYITTKHYRSDASFRRAIEFIHTDEFRSVSQQIAESAPYQQALQRFSDAGVNTDSIANISIIMNCLLLQMPVYGETEASGDSGMQKWIVPRTLQTFAQELMKAIPRADFSSLVSQKIARSKEFASFYRIVRSSSFSNTVRNGLRSYPLQYPLSVLKRNGIDLCKLAQIAFKILSWGPKYY